MNALAQFLTVGAVSLTAATATFLIQGPPPRLFLCAPTTLKPGEICLSQVPTHTPILWVDGRTEQEWAQNGLPGSILWKRQPIADLPAFEAEIVAKVLETPRVIVYCGDENCGLSHEIAKAIERLDLDADISVLKGGWRALNEAGRIPPRHHSN